ncbi:chromate transporter [Sedimentibacter sp.]|uniref:chromate transporter n=1 Tax=Sedimentibacter sp. TaxID=1960295 RepID=UPI0028AB867A|nr:chromate transporter [Sedimentibacter sp.]
MKTRENSGNNNKVRWRTFLKDVFICSLGAYGGPEAHYGVFTDQLVIKKSYLTEEELIELIALTGILPGPSSTQTIVAIGHKIGGPLLAFLTMLVWALPVTTVMTLLSFLSQFLGSMNISQDTLRYVGPMAVGFIIVAAYRIGRKVVTDKITLLLLLIGGIITYIIREPWIYPLVLISGGLVSIITSKEKNLWNRVKINPPWRYLIAFGIFAIGSLLLTLIWDNKILHLFESFYRYGYLVIGGGQVVVPLMYSELVEVNQYMTNQEFLTGFGLIQGLPGPMFSFSAYAGGMTARGGSVLTQITGAVAGGLITVAAIILMQKSEFAADNILVILITVILLFIKKIPAPLIVLFVLIAGFVV